MKTKQPFNRALALVTAVGLGFHAYAGTFKHIAIDGSFGDWTGVPLAHTQAASAEATNAISYKDIYLANDADYLYIRFSIYPPATNPFTSLQNIYVNTDNRSTGYGPTSYDSFGSEMLIQGGEGFQQKNGSFNEGPIVNLGWAAAPATGTNFEMRVSRHASYTNGVPVFTQHTIALALESENSTYTPVDYAPANCCGLVYTFATNNMVAVPAEPPPK